VHYLFLDESGDHGLSKINPDFPVFVLCGIIFHEDDYNKCNSKIIELKHKFWGNKEVILHSSDIRRCEKEFQILLDQDIKREFFVGLNSFITDSNYSIIAVGIKKEEYIEKYGRLTASVYELALSFIIERAIFFLDEQPGPKRLLVYIEERGKKEDAELKDYFIKLLNRGTNYVSALRLESANLRMEFRSKKKNINGLQLADLIAYPIATHIMNKNRANPAYDLFSPKFYMKQGKVYGFKTFP